MQNYKFYNNTYRANGKSLGPIPFVMLSFQQDKIHNMLAMMLDPHFKRLGLLIQYVGKERVLQIASEYDINACCFHS
jgi:hypothetical protein